ncbi:MAG TPA: type II toxin-antitoxin system HicA family toxin [Stellaceae bacterium]|nr:type II toxin-antitoxin system HicA family toxin [Stellaceae bacterium]
MTSSREIIEKLQAAGWVRVKVRGDHHQFKHPERPGKVTVIHPEKDIGIPLIKSIERQSGVKLR